MTMPKDWGKKPKPIRTKAGYLTKAGLLAGHVEEVTYIPHGSEYDVIATLRFVPRPLSVFCATLVYWDGRKYQRAAVFEHIRLAPAREAYRGYVSALRVIT